MVCWVWSTFAIPETLFVSQLLPMQKKKKGIVTCLDSHLFDLRRDFSQFCSIILVSFRLVVAVMIKWETKCTFSSSNMSGRFWAASSKITARENQYTNLSHAINGEKSSPRFPTKSRVTVRFLRASSFAFLSFSSFSFIATRCSGVSHLKETTQF